MDKTVPTPAARLLDFIGPIESAPGTKGYETVYGHNQSKLPKPLTQMTIGEVLAAGPGWARRWKSSACGRYQFMAGSNHTLRGLDTELGLRDNQVFDPNLQDRLGYHLLRRRGYDAWVSGTLSDVAFGLALAKEWASMPVLAATKGAHRAIKRGQSYYSGDALNKSLVNPERVEAVLKGAKGLARGGVATAQADLKVAEKDSKTKAGGAVAGAAATGGGGTVAAAQVDATTFDWTAWAAVGVVALLVALVIFLLARYAMRQARLAAAYKQELVYHTEFSRG